MRNPLNLLLSLTSTLALADLHRGEGLFDESDLDEAFDNANYVFVATFVGESERGVVLNYKLHTSALKGAVPSTGEITQTSSCWGIFFLNNGAILILFTDFLDQLVPKADWSN